MDVCLPIVLIFQMRIGTVFYDRAIPVGKTSPILLEDNVWIGDRAIVGKGVSIGKNSIVAAGSVVVKDVHQIVVVGILPVLSKNSIQILKE